MKQHAHTQKECFQNILNKISVIICRILINRAFIRSDMQGGRFLSFKINMREFYQTTLQEREVVGYT